MNPELEKILGCPNLPSLPAVALQVIELTADVDVSLKELARVIQNDQGLTAKVLKTVNSSFYGLRKRCATIDKAIVMLGLAPVKSLALGFSLADSIHDPNDSGGFDYVAYWRRGLFTGVAGKIVAERAGFEFGDEVFLGGLLQDVGMIAMYKALGQTYVDVLQSAGGDHRDLVRHELQMLDLQHPAIGAMLVERWKLPEELSLPVKYHERPSAAPGTFQDHIRFVGLGNYVHDVLTVEDPKAPLQALYEKSKAWYELDSTTIDEIVTTVAEAGREMASLFKLDIGTYTDPEAVLAAASKQAVTLMRKSTGSGEGAPPAAQEGSVLAGSDTDPLTGAVGPRGFEIAVREGFRYATEHDEMLSLVEVVIDNFADLAASQGECADDEAVMGLAGLLKLAFDGQGGAVCHVTRGTFAIVLPGMGRQTATALAEAFVADLARDMAEWTAPATNQPLRFTTSVGVAALEPETRDIFKEPRQLVLACAKAIEASQANGGGSMRVFQPRAKAA
ncbi:MAG: HDOD domain-containing protein [Phycisphaerales bacterium JB054]